MKFSTILLSLLFLTSLESVQAQQSAANEYPAFEHGQLLVQILDVRKAETLLSDLSQLNGQNTKLDVDYLVSEPMKIYLLTYDQDQIDPHEMLRAVNNHPAINIAQFNHKVELRETIPNDPQFAQQWHHLNSGAGGATADADIDSDEAWDITTGGTTALGDDIVVCVIEGGNLNHIDLQGNAWVNEQEIPNNGIDDDENGYVDDYLGWNVNSNDDGDLYSSPHGTQVMGMIGAQGDNDLGVVGANWNVKIMPVSGQSANNEATVVAAYTYPMTQRQLYNETNGAKGAFVVATNASWGIDSGDPEDSPLWCAVYDSLGVRGILNCGATTNSALNVDVEGDLPTACPSPYMVSVTATDNQDVRTFSGYGLTTINVGAPGDAVYTTSGTDGYGSATGTSFASPLTAGVIGLLYSAPCASLIQIAKANPQLGADMVLEALYEGVDIIPNLIDEVSTGGRINAHNSLLYILDNCTEGGCIIPFSTNVSQEENTTNYTLSWDGLDALTYDLRYRVEGDPEWIDVTNIVQSNFLAADLLYCTTYEFQVRANCEEESSDYSTSVIWTTDGCCENPLLSVDDITSSSAQASWESVLAAESFNIRYRPIGSTSWTEVNEIEDVELTIDELDECTSYEVQIQTVCIDDQEEEFSESVTFSIGGCETCQDLGYCQSMGESALYEWMESVEINDFSNVSGANGGYENFTDETILLLAGSSPGFTLAPGYAGTTYNEHFVMWLDYNQNGEFEEDEMVYDSGTGITTAVSGSFTIPDDAMPGATRLRIAMKYVAGSDWTAPAPAPEPCEVYEYGETEDYCVFIDNPTVSVERLSNQFSVYPNPAVSEIVLELSGYAFPAGGLNYQITDMTGRRILENSFSTQRTSIDIQSLNQGMYILNIYDGKTRIGTEQIVKSK